MNKKLYNKILRARKLAEKHRLLSNEIDNDFEELGFNTHTMRNDDFLLLTDMCDYGTGFVSYEEAKKEIEEYGGDWRN